MHLLRIKILDSCPNKEFVKNYYENVVTKLQYQGDAGIDIIFPEDIEFVKNTVTKCHMGIACEFIPNGCKPDYHHHGPSTFYGSFDLVPRSSISNTPLGLANSIGIFDAGYRGEVIAAIRCYKPVGESAYSVKKGDRLVQIISPDRKSIKVQLVTELSKTERQDNGFGSTNTKQI